MDNNICKEEIANWLEGTHILQGVEVIHNCIVPDGWGGSIETNAILIRLDGINYLFVEDPADGYRSYMREIMTTDKTPKYILPDIEVTIKHITDPIPGSFGGYTNDFYDFYEGNNLILRVGTEDVDDYYPCCILEYHPENLNCNLTVKENTPTMTVFDFLSNPAEPLFDFIVSHPLVGIIFFGRDLDCMTF